VALAADTAELYVSDGNNHRIQVFDLDGKLLRTWGSFGLGAKEMNGPSGLDFDDQGNLLVAMAYGSPARGPAALPR
jgi:tripartite motif-containing protein 71